MHSPDAAGWTVSHEAIYRWIYALPNGEWAKSGILLRSTRPRHNLLKVLGERKGGRIGGMISMDDRPEQASDRSVPGWWEGELIVGKRGRSAAVARCWRIGVWMMRGAPVAGPAESPPR
nr:hypothetical protein [Tomitella cavernea]